MSESPASCISLHHTFITFLFLRCKNKSTGRFHAANKCLLWCSLWAVDVQLCEVQRTWTKSESRPKWAHQKVRMRAGCAENPEEFPVSFFTASWRQRADALPQSRVNWRGEKNSTSHRERGRKIKDHHICPQTRSLRRQSTSVPPSHTHTDRHT